MSTTTQIFPTRLLQIALVTPDLAKTTENLVSGLFASVIKLILCKTQLFVLGTELLYINPLITQWGLINALSSLGDDVLELVFPIHENTTSSRLLNKRGEGGYMIIMQTGVAAKRRESITSRDLVKVIFGYENKEEDCVCVQCHPNNIKVKINHICEKLFGPLRGE